MLVTARINQNQLFQFYKIRLRPRKATRNVYKHESFNSTKYD